MSKFIRYIRNLTNNFLQSQNKSRMIELYIHYEYQLVMRLYPGASSLENEIKPHMININKKSFIVKTLPNILDYLLSLYPN